MDYLSEYKSKLRTAKEAVKCVKSGDWVEYTSNLGYPPTLDKALSERRDELRNVKIRSYPALAMLMPAIWNGVVVGWEIEYFFIEGDFEWIGFLTQGGLVALGEVAVMLTLGTAVYCVMVKRRLDKKLFPTK